MFSASMIVVIKRLRKALMELDALFPLPDGALEALVGPLDGLLQADLSHVVDISYVDDLLLPVIHYAEEIVGMLPLVLCAVTTAFVTCGFLLNWKVGKTSVLPVFFGTGSRKVAMQFASDFPDFFPFVDAIKPTPHASCSISS